MLKVINYNDKYEGRFMGLHLRFALLVLLMTLVSCGSGGDGFDDPEDPIVGTTTITLSISSNSVTEQNPAVVTAVVREDGSVVSGVVVDFSTLNDIARLSTDAVLTNSDGIAEVTLFAGTESSADYVVASLNTGEEAQIGFTTVGVSETVVRLGSGEPFVEGTIELGLSQISAGGTTVISVLLVDENDELYDESVVVNFTSSCAEQSTPLAEIDAEVVTSNGQANATYLAKGCVGDDLIRVVAEVNGNTLTATGSVNVLPASIGSIQFTSATPESIGIIGTGAVGGSDSSTIVFQVLDTNGNPVNNQLVNFTLNTSSGGINIIPTSATTNTQGYVQTVVNSGTVATSIRVTAVIDGISEPEIKSQSSALVIEGGLPDQDSFSLSANILNPEAWGIDGQEVEVTARLADAYNNHVPDGTAISFTTEGGVIESSCLTVDGGCTVTWSSQDPRPEGHVIGDINNIGHLPETANTMGQMFGGRVSIIATAIGEESFPDANGNGRFDSSEMSAFLGNDVSGQPYDRGEAYADYNEDGFFNPGEDDVNEQEGGDLEELIDFDGDLLYTPKDNLYNGGLCSIPAHAGCSIDKQSINVRDELVIVMSGSHANFVTTVPAGGADLVISGESTATASVIIADLHNQPMPAGSVIEFTASVGSVVAGSPVTWGNDNHNGGGEFSVTVKGETEPKEGDLIVEITTPGGVKSAYTVAHIVINAI